MSTTNGWDLVCGFNQDYLSALGAYLYDSGKFPHGYQSGAYDLTLEPPDLTISADSPNTIAFKVSFEGTQAGKPISGYVNMAVDLSKVAIDYVNQPSYLQLGGNSSDYADCGNLDSFSSQGCTLEAWINTSVKTAQNILVFDGGSPSLSMNNNRLTLNWDGANLSTDGTDISDGNWHHVAVVVDNNEITFYKDGQAKDEVPLFGGSTKSSAGDLRLGYENGGSSAFAGNLAQVRVWAVARTTQQIQQSLNANLSSSQTGLIGYWIFTDDAVINQVNKQQGTLSGSAAIVAQTQPSFASYLLFWDPQNTFTVTSDVTIGTASGDNPGLDRTITASMEAYASSAHIMGSQSGGSTFMPTTINFITRISASNPNADQMLGLMMTQNRLQPSEDPNQAFADDPQTLIPSGSNSVVGLWDYVFLYYMMAPAMVKALHVDSSQIQVTAGEPSQLVLQGEVNLKKMRVTKLKMYINDDGLFLGVQGYICNELIFASLQATLNLVVNNAASAAEQSIPAQSASEQPALGKVLFSFKNSPAERSAETFVLTMWNPYVRDTASDTLTLSLKNVSFQLAWNQSSPDVQNCEEVLALMPVMAPCIESCCQGILLLIQETAVSKATAKQQQVSLTENAKFDLNEIVFDDGFILFGTAIPGGSSSA